MKVLNVLGGLQRSQNEVIPVHKHMDPNKTLSTDNMESSVRNNTGHTEKFASEGFTVYKTGSFLLLVAHR